MKAVIYCRVSTIEQTENLSLPTQQRSCEEYCDQHGIEVAKVFIEEGESAKTRDRTQLKTLLEYCGKNKKEIQYIVFYSISRFSRNSYDFQVLRGMLLGLGITLRSATEAIDDSSMGRFMETILSGVAQLDNDLRADRTIEGMKEAWNLGRWTFSPPIGYLKPPKDSGKPSLVPDPERSQFVHDAFDLFASGVHSKKEVLDRINALGLTTRKGKTISNQTFSGMIKNPIYAGWVSVPSRGVMVRGDFEPLISQELFDRVQAILTGKRKTVRPKLRNHPDFPLRHFVRCGACGKPMTGSRTTGRNRKYSYYHCRTKSCGQVRVRTGELESAFLELLGSLKPKSNYIKLFRAIVEDVWKKRHHETALDRKALERREKGLLERKDKLIAAHLYEGKIGEEDFQRQKDLLGGEIGLVRMELHETTLEVYNLESILSFAERVLTDASRLWMNFELDQRQRFQQLIFPEGLEYDGERFRTAPTCGMFTYLQQIGAGKDHLASPTGIEPVLPP